ncbi:hypothetical protein B0T17DRAFT_508408 [Bombardia bombarda]|uniref:Uncharacterized protein n=1 Tax=Bombardia bombarda TaxID=252184 RepID=A0AA40C537_9PEZI|nr:hypothetical protein B0T17DRAFT_508408 [Bombardia bombarda]
MASQNHNNQNQHQHQNPAHPGKTGPPRAQLPLRHGRGTLTYMAAEDLRPANLASVMGFFAPLWQLAHEVMLQADYHAGRAAGGRASGQQVSGVDDEAGGGGDGAGGAGADDVAVLRARAALGDGAGQDGAVAADEAVVVGRTWRLVVIASTWCTLVGILNGEGGWTASMITWILSSGGDSDVGY